MLAAQYWRLKMKESQTKRIFEYLEKGNSLTSLGALRKFDCLRLGARVYDLRKLGFDIKSKIIRLSSGKHVASYKLGD